MKSGRLFKSLLGSVNAIEARSMAILTHLPQAGLLTLTAEFLDHLGISLPPAGTNQHEYSEADKNWNMKSILFLTQCSFSWTPE